MQKGMKMDVQKHRWRQWLKEAWHGIIGNTAYDIMKWILAVLWIVVGPWLISLGQRALGAAIPAVREALSAEVVLTVGTISTVILWFLFGFIFAGIVGTISSKILWHRGRVTAIRKPQTTSLTTEKTLRQVLADGCKGLFMRIILIVLFVIPWLVGIFLFLTALIFGREKIIAFVRNIAQLQ
jgi:hypothetical protein